MDEDIQSSVTVLVERQLRAELRVDFGACVLIAGGDVDAADDRSGLDAAASALRIASEVSAADPSRALFEVAGEGRVVLAAARAPQSPAFTPSERTTVRALANEVQAATRPEDEVTQWRREGPFRLEAIEAAAAGAETGEVLRVAPGWVRPLYWAALAVVGMLLSTLAVVENRRYSRAEALLVAGRTHVVVARTGTLWELAVESGATVVEGQVVARLYGVDERAELEQQQHEYESRLRDLLYHPGDTEAQDDVLRLSAGLASARRELEGRTLRAPMDGVVMDVRFVTGQQLTPGDRLMSLRPATDARSSLRVCALFPGRDAAKLRVGAPMRLEVDGYPYQYVELRVARVANEVVPSADATHCPRSADESEEPVVEVLADLAWDDNPAAVAGGRFVDGLRGVVQVEVAREPLLLTLMPSLRKIWGNA